MKQCSACHGVHVRRSTFHPGEREAHSFQSPYECEDCGARFWVLSRHVRTRVVTTAIVFAMVVILSTGFATLLSGIGSAGRDSTVTDGTTSTNLLQLVPVNPPTSSSRR